MRITLLFTIYSLLKKKKNLKIYDFLSRGVKGNIAHLALIFQLSDIQDQIGKYKEYHTSLDNLNIISQKNLEDSLEPLLKLVEICETCMYPTTNFYCEPMLSKKNLTPSLSSSFSLSKRNKVIRDFIAYSDGKRSIFEISNIINCELNELVKIFQILNKNKILKNNFKRH